VRFRLPVSSSSLRARALETPERSIAKAALLPLFDREGKVRRVIFLDPSAPGIWFFDPAVVRVRIPLWGPIRLDSGPGELQLLSPGGLAALGEVWHFDPWWLLADRRYARSEVAATLKATNCFEPLSKTGQRLLYRWNLCRAGWIATRDKGYVRLGPLLADLPPAERPCPVAAPRVARPGVWVLDPFWARKR
jgi:hypothetical protein